MTDLIKTKDVKSLKFNGSSFNSKKIDKSKKKGRVLVAMSGGVDSSVAAALLVQEGYEVIGITMQVWDYSDCSLEKGSGSCCSSVDVEDARVVADKIGIPFYVLNCEAFFKEKVIRPFVDSYLQGKTPIPCINCNTYLKFDHLFEKMNELNCDYLATGHYAKIQKSKLTGRLAITTSTDDWKDQTYFLFTLDPRIVEKLMFPVGDMKKPDIRVMANEMGLGVAKKKDSVGICFIENGKYASFVEKHSGSRQIVKGELKHYPSKKIFGMHQGIHNFTYGQRKGLGVSYSEPLYVIKIEPDTGTVWLGSEEHLYKEELYLLNSHFLDDWVDGEELFVKIRFQHRAALARAYRQEEKVFVKFKEPQRSITPGQAAVFYRDRQLIGGGWIC